MSSRRVRDGKGAKIERGKGDMEKRGGGVRGLTSAVITSISLGA